MRFVWPAHSIQNAGKPGLERSLNNLLQRVVTELHQLRLLVLRQIVSSPHGIEALELHDLSCPRIDREREELCCCLDAASRGSSARRPSFCIGGLDWRVTF